LCSYKDHFFVSRKKRALVLLDKPRDMMQDETIVGKGVVEMMFVADTNTYNQKEKIERAHV